MPVCASSGLELLLQLYDEHKYFVYSETSLERYVVSDLICPLIEGGERDFSMEGYSFFQQSKDCFF